MVRSRILVAASCLLWLVQGVYAAEPAVLVASGTVVKANPNLVILRPRLPDGKFGPALSLKIRGTSKVTTLGSQTRGNQVIVVQKDTAPQELEPNQVVGVIYTSDGSEYVLLSGVVQPR